MTNLILPTILMKRPNEKKTIFRGKCDIIKGEVAIKKTVIIYYEWIPDIAVKAKISEVPYNFADKPLVIKGPGFIINDFFITNITGFKDVDITGIVSGEFKIGTKLVSRKIYKIDFSLINLRVYFGRILDFEDPGGHHRTMGELKLISENTELVIHKYFKDRIQRELLSKYGGFLSTHGGTLLLKDGISEDKYLYYVKRIGLFFSFFNGRRCFPNFLKTYDKNGKLIFRDYTPFFVDKNKNVVSWIPQTIDEKFQDLWDNFLQLTQEDDDFERVDLIIHWYLEALNNSGFVNGSIILIQNSFELLFNWIFNEQKRIISNEGIEKIRASDKLKLLLDKFNLGFNLPDIYLKKYHNEIKRDSSLSNFPYQFTEFRNHFVHFKNSKKSKITDKPEAFSYALLNTSIFNLEQILLKILKYNGKICSRVSENPWQGSNEIEIK